LGHRANLVIVDGDGYELFYCHGCATAIPQEMFWGSQFANSWIRHQQDIVKDAWMNQTWAEGGALVDLQNRILLLFGGEDLLFDIPLRRVYLEVLQENWLEWKVQWAHDGIAEIAGYVGIDRTTLITAAERLDDEISLTPPQDRLSAIIIASLVDQNGDLRLFPLDGLSASEWLAYGVDFIDAAQNGGMEHLPLHEWLQHDGSNLLLFPLGGFHIDQPQKRLSIWSAHDPCVADRVKAFWDGWELHWLTDNYEFQLEHTRGQLTFPQHDLEACVARLDAMLMVDISGSLDRRVPPSTRRQILDHAIAAWTQKRQDT
jgi:hypothetical protein